MCGKRVTLSGPEVTSCQGHEDDTEHKNRVPRPAVFVWGKEHPSFTFYPRKMLIKTWLIFIGHSPNARQLSMFFTSFTSIISMRKMLSYCPFHSAEGKPLNVTLL